MKNGVSILLAGCIILISCTDRENEAGNLSTGGKDEIQQHMLEKVSYLDVAITDNFWKPKIEINRISGIRHALNEAASSIVDFDIAAGKSDKQYTGGGSNDSNVYKIIQGAAYALHHSQDKELESIIDSVIDRIVAAQLPDGYLFSYWIANDLSQRWTDLKRKHELYCAGHMFEAAVAYFEVTGKRKFLDAAIRFADHIDSVFGPDKRQDVPGHQEIELALYKLYKVTNEKRYLDLSIFFLEERGNPERIADALIPPEHDPRAGTPWRWRPPSYMQDHLPITEQYYAIGHAVRATYMYSAITDIAHETCDQKYLPALDSIWENIVTKKLYITGGIGTKQHHDEGFGSDYLLPNDQAYCETCANIGLTFWNRRMCLLYGDAKYADLVELTMYNSGISGVSLSGDRFFYTNPLESDGTHVRRTWFNPPCCPTNIVRFLPEIGTTIYGKTDQAIYVNQFIGSEVSLELNDNKIKLKQETEYPWYGSINLTVDPEIPSDFNIFIRIPGWAQGQLIPSKLYHYYVEKPIQGFSLKINNKTIRKLSLHNGYAIIKRKWKKGDIIQLHLPMDVRLVEGNPKIEDTKGKFVLMRGPLVYCMEEIDNKVFFENPDQIKVIHSDFRTDYRDDLLGDFVTIKGTAVSSTNDNQISITAIPYFAWANRGQGQMIVWLPAQE